MLPVDGFAALQSIDVVPLGGLGRGQAERLTVGLSRLVKIPCYLNGSPFRGELRLLPGREQVDADHLLRQLEQHEAPAGAAIVGITDVDIALPILTHIFGGARDGGHTAVVSLARLDQEFYGLPADVALTERRAVAEILHEVGHLLGLAHCRAYDCLMHFCPDVETIDLRGSSFCLDCAGALPAGVLPASRPW